MTRPPSRKDLRVFGLVVGGVFLAIGLWPLVRHGAGYYTWAIAVGGTLAGLGLAIPGVLKPAYAAWMRLGLMLAWINTRLILGLVFYGMITPIGFVFRLMRKDPMRRQFQPEVSTYRVPKDARRPGHMKVQF